MLAWIGHLTGRRSAGKDHALRGDGNHGANPSEHKFDVWLKLDPILARRVIPGLVLLFLVALGVTRLSMSFGDRVTMLKEARRDTAAIAMLLNTNLSLDEAKGVKFDAETFLATLVTANVLPAEAVVLVTNRDGTILASLPAKDSRVGSSIFDHVSDPRELMASDAGGHVLQIGLDGDEAIATAAKLPGDGGQINFFWPHSTLLAAWRQDCAMKVSLFALTAAILLLVLIAYFRQSRRAEGFSGLCAETQHRIDIALSRGKCGLWDWDVARGQMYWSRSMYEILGMEPRDGVMPFSEVAPLMHREDGGLFTIARNVAEGKADHLDQVFRMRRADGSYVWIRGCAKVVPSAEGELHLIGIAVDVSEQLELARQTNEANHRLKNTIEQISETFLLCDSEDRVVISNSIYRKTFGLSEDDIAPGTPLDKVMRKARRPIRSITLDGEDLAPGESAVEAQMPDGRWLLISSRRAADGGTVWVGTDITQIKHHKTLTQDSRQKLLATIAKLEVATADAERKADQLSELNLRYVAEKDRAERASRAKTAFLANMSHELRTPLNAILGFSDIIRQRTFGSISDKYGEYVDDIFMSGNHLLRMIDDILQMATIESGRLELCCEAIDFGDIVRRSEALIEPLARKKNVDLFIEAPKQLSLLSDRRASSQVVLNLLSNAVKFTPEGGEVRLRLRQIGDTACLTIADNGPGIPREALASLGLPFVEVESELLRSKSRGTGLGIAIARALVRLHGGQMRITSRVGHGTVVSLRLPLNQTRRDRRAHRESHDRERAPALREMPNKLDRAA
ncbi:ATP-binding protein [Jiella flava]|uniref:ATP-binding protein n=1 Tax=Jiella flava TaxID=2816857 RepID=UPI001E30976C|nr:ATP-binding protein [Jiella flava]